MVSLIYWPVHKPTTIFILQRLLREGNHCGESLTHSQKKRKTEVRPRPLFQCSFYTLTDM